MTSQKLSAYCKDQPGVEHEYKTDWEADVFKIGGKMFAFIGADKNGEAIINLKNLPPENFILREKYEDWCIPGYYSNKDHWNSWYWQRAAMDEKILREQIKISYQLVGKSLPKKVQAELGLT